MDFKIPDGYFEKMQDEVFIKIHRHEKKLHQRKIFYSIGSIAASLLIIFSVVHFFPHEKSDNLASLVLEKKESYSTNDSLVNQDITDMKNDTEVPKNKVSMKQRIAEIKLDNLDYDIIEYYEESIYDLALLDLYY